MDRFCEDTLRKTCFTFDLGSHESIRSTLRAASKKEIAVSENHMSALRLKHAELEAQLEVEETRPYPDDDLIHRIKKHKLALKDAMAQELASA